jgi:hypothetical protein
MQTNYANMNKAASQLIYANSQFLSGFKKVSSIASARPIAYLGIYVKKFKRCVRIIAHAMQLIKFLGRVLKNPIELGWEYDIVSYIKVDSRESERSVRKSHSRSSKIEKVASGIGGNSLVNYVLSSRQQKQLEFTGWLPYEIRDLFRKAPNERTHDDIEALCRFCAPMKGFRRFTATVQVHLLLMRLMEA